MVVDWTKASGMLAYEQGATPFRETTQLSPSDQAQPISVGTNEVLPPGSRIEAAEFCCSVSPHASASKSSILVLSIFVSLA